MSVSYKPSTPQERAQLEELANILRIPVEEVQRLLGEKMGAMTQKAEEMGLRFKANPFDAIAGDLGLTEKAPAAGRYGTEDQTGTGGRLLGGKVAKVEALKRQIAEAEAQLAELLADRPGLAEKVAQRLAEKARRAQQGPRGALEATVKDLGF